MKRVSFQLALLVFALAPLWVRAGGNEVVVVYNSSLPESRAVAEYYAKARQVPENQIFGFSLTTNEVMSRSEFRDSLQLSLAEKLETGGLWKLARTTQPATNGQPKRVFERVVDSKIRYAVLCYGVPLKIAPDADLHEHIGTNMPPQLQRNEASVDSELAWLPVIDLNPPITGPLQNLFYGVTNATTLNPTNGILLVARLDGPTADLARGLVDKALQGERDGLWGRAYFDTRGLTPSQTNYWLGDEWILGAARISKALGFETIVDDKPGLFPLDFPMSHIALYAGWYADSACGPFQLPNVEFMPGAFAYHLHSFSAATLRSASEGWCGPFVAKGATCTMGCVYEPYLIFTPNVALFLERFTMAQFTFGEAAWAAQATLSWQTTVVGDPLYRPFGKAPKQLLQELSDRHSPLVEWSYLRVLNATAVRGLLPGQLSNMIENSGISTNSAVLTEKLADLYVTEGRPLAAIDTYERALTLKPSPEQRIRLRLALGQSLQKQDFNAAAKRDYQKLLEEAPDYNGKAAIEGKINALSQKPANTNAPAAH